MKISNGTLSHWLITILAVAVLVAGGVYWYVSVTPSGDIIPEEEEYTVAVARQEEYQELTPAIQECLQKALGENLTAYLNGEYHLEKDEEISGVGACHAVDDSFESDTTFADYYEAQNLAMQGCVKGALGDEFDDLSADSSYAISDEHDEVLRLCFE